MQQNKSTFLGTEKLFPLLLKMSIPAIVGSMAVALYNVVDTIFVGRGVGSQAIAGLAVAFPVQIVVQAFAQMIGIGAASIISRSLGEKNFEKASSALGTAFSSITVIILVVTTLTAIFTVPILRLFGATDTILPQAQEYLKTVLWGFPVIGFSIAGNNLIRSEGKARIAMGTMLIGMGMNIILDPIFIFGFKMGIRGAALATVISQGLSFLWILFFYLHGNSSIPMQRKHLRINLSQLREMVVLGIPNAVQMAGMSILTMIINKTLGSISGDMAISTYGMVHRLLSFVIMPLMGLAQGFQPIAGYNFGAKQYTRVKRVMFLTILSASTLSLIFFLLIRYSPELLLGLFTTEKDFIAFSTNALKITSLFMPIMSIQVTTSVYFQAIGKGLHALLLGLSRQFIILIPLVLILPRFFGLNGVWACFPVSDFLSTVISFTFLMFEIRHLNQYCRTEEALAT